MISSSLKRFLEEQKYTGALNEAARDFLKDEGYSDQYSQAWRKFLNAQGYSGSLSEATRKAEAAGFFTGGYDPRDRYAAGGETPRIVADFVKGKYSLDSGAVDFGDVLSLSRSSTATYTNSGGDFVTVAANEPRTGHHVWDGSGWTCEGVLLNPDSSTNLADYSEASTANWTSEGATPTDLALNVMDEFRGVRVASTGGSWNRLRPAPLSLTAGDTHGVTFYYVEGTSGQARITIRNSIAGTETQLSGPAGNLSVTQSDAGTVSLLDQQSVTNRGYTVHIVRLSFTVAATSTSFTFGLGPNSTVVGEDVIVLGAQIDSLNVPTQYIPTSGSQITRASESLLIASSTLSANGFSPMPAECSISLHWLANYFDDDMFAEQRPIRWRDPVAPNDQIRWELSTKDADTGQGVFVQRASSSDYFSTTLEDDTHPGVDVSLKYASRHTATELRGASSGVLASPNSPTAMPDLAGVDLDVAHAGAQFVVSQFVLWDANIGDTGLTEASSD